MKQIIRKNYDGSIYNKFYKNHLNQLNRLSIYYLTNGNIHWKRNYINDKKIGLNTYYHNDKPKQIIYNL